ncbi:beta-galactosidase-1-like protein 2 isoform 5-T6 [Spinachia spinachia]
MYVQFSAVDRGSMAGLRLSLKQRYLVLLCLAVGALAAYHFSRNRLAGRRTSRVDGLRANSSQFTLEGEPFRLLGGSVHYFRVPRAYWEDRLLKMKACGLNTLTTYVPWNLHEPERGVFDFEDQLDLEAYLRLAGRLGLWVILRPGPYICAEWDLGGLPSWLLRDQHMKLRTTYPRFTDAVDSFFDQLIKRVVPHQYSEGGPIIALQVENEHGSYAKDGEYMPFIKEALLSRGVTELLLTSDNKGGLKRGGVKGALETINFQKLNRNDIKYLDGIQPHRPKMVMEYWSGWFDLWGDLHHEFPAEDMVRVVTEILKLDMSINLYMFHGGTNFGFMSGAFAVEMPAPKPMVTSYDYDAPLSEAGDYTAKYHLLRDVFSRYHAQPLPEPPPRRGRRAYQPVVIQQHVSLWDSLHFTHKGKRTLSLLVENCGRVNYGSTLDEQRKGLVGDIEFNKRPLRGFLIRSLEMKPAFVNSLCSSGHWASVRQRPTFPAFFQAKLYVSGSPTDTFIKLPGWSKGVAFINGKNLGRYWSIGPQQTLYVPGPWLHRGDNQVVVFEEQETDGRILFSSSGDYGMSVDVQ